ncbi:MAG: hypothetical protein PHH59_01035 [Methylovulum sp.]|uniref:hypothetical protein n=1 Tax=Methylovulum sp. TaxID=1916980 RepID=UPI00262442A8|nr:hypothetical protein [Methylovulum sp.]MDD2722592.1 hypothetical protein [Methylovulum sp.]MDD5123120.1 hypothetical protein [Methylovulum sp.]
MSILDEIRQRAAEKKQAQHQQSLLDKKLEQTYQKELLPKMQLLYDSLKELVEYLNFLEEPMPVSHYSNHYPQFGRLYQKNYKINTDGRMGMADFQRMMQINISFYCEAEGSFSYGLSSKSLIDKEYNFLFEHGLRFQQKQQHTDRAMFVVERKIPVRFQVLVDYASSKLKITIFNHENFQTFQKSFFPEQLDDEFLNMFLSYFMRRDNRIVVPDISEEEKAVILKHIAPFYAEQRNARPDLFEAVLEKRANLITDPVKKIFTRFNKL